MAKNDTGLVQLGDVAQAIMLLSRLPVPFSATDRGARAAWAYPVAGIVLGGLSAIAAGLAHAAGLPAVICALVAVVTMVVTTGAMHEDGLADTADGLWGGWTPERRLEIMKDSHIGTYGVLAIVAAFAARMSVISVLISQDLGTACAAIVVAATVSRSTMPALMTMLPNARDTGLSHSVGAPSVSVAALAGAIGLVTAVLLSGAGGLAALIWAGFIAVLIGWVAKRKIGGQTGDILGACQQMVEIAVLLSLLA